MGVKRTRLDGQSDVAINLSVPPGFVSLTSFTLKKVEKSEQGPSRVSATLDIISTGKLKNSVGHRPWLLDDRVDHLEEDLETEADKVIARCRPELARLSSLEEAPVFHPTDEEFKDTLKYVASILPNVKPYGVCRIVPPDSWVPPHCIEEETTSYGVNTHVQHISNLQSLAGKTMNNKHKKVSSKSSEIGHDVKCKELGCCMKNFEFESGPKFTLKSFKNHADHFKRQYFFNLQPSVLDIEEEYWRIIENPIQKIEVFQGQSMEARATSSGFPIKYYPQYVESGWNLNNTPKLQDSLLRFESRDNPSILLPRVSMGMCFSSNVWRIEEHHLYFLSYVHFGAPKIFYGVPGSYRCKFEETIKKHLHPLSLHPGLLHNLPAQFSPSTLTSEGIPVYRCMQNPKEFVLIIPGAYHAEFDTGYNCSEGVNFAPLDWLPHGQSAVERYCEWGRKTSISHDKLLLEAATEAIRALAELLQQNKDSFDNLKWRAVCQGNGVLAKAFKSRVTSEARRRKYMCASLESRKMEQGFCATTKRECSICFYDLYLSAIGCECSPDKYTCLLHGKQLCACAWSDKYLLIRNEIDELNIMVEALDVKVKAIHEWTEEKVRLPVSDIIKEKKADDESEVSLNLWSHSKENVHDENEVSLNHWSRSKETAEDENEISLNLWMHSEQNVHQNEVSFPKLSQHTRVDTRVGKSRATQESSSNERQKGNSAHKTSSNERNVIIVLSDDDEN